MDPAIAECLLVEHAQVGFERRLLEEQRPGREQETQRVLDRIHVIDERPRFDEVEQVEIAAGGGPGGERDEGRPEREIRLPHELERRHHVGARMALGEIAEDAVVERLHRRDHEGTAERLELREERPMREEVLHLHRHVEGEIGEATVELAQDRHHVPRSVQEVRIAERHVAGSGAHLRRNVGQHDWGRHDEEAPAVDRRDRAVAAEMQASAARLDIARGNPLAFALKLRISDFARLSTAARRREVEAREMGRCRAAAHRHPRNRRQRLGARSGKRTRQRLGERDQRPFRFPGNHRIAFAGGEQVLGVEPRIEAVVDEHRSRIERPHLARGLDADPERGVHGHRDADECRPSDPFAVEALDRQVETGGSKTRPIEERRGRSQADRLVPELVAGDEEDVSGMAHQSAASHAAGRYFDCWGT
jgi:hypothetical protein